MLSSLLIKELSLIIKLGFVFFFLSTSESQNKTKGEDYPFFLTTICTSLYKLGHYWIEVTLMQYGYIQTMHSWLCYTGAIRFKQEPEFSAKLEIDQYCSNYVALEQETWDFSKRSYKKHVAYSFCGHRIVSQIFSLI